VRRLQHITDVRVQPELAAFPRVAAIDQNAAPRRLKEAADEIDQRGFSRARLADNGDVRALRDLQIKVFQHVFAAVGIAEGDVLKFNVAVKRLPVFLFGVERVAVLFRDLRRVADVGFRFQKPCDALDVDLHVDERRHDLHEPLDRLHHALRIVHKHRQRTDQDHAVSCDHTAAPQDDRQRNGRGEGRRGHEHAAEVHGADAQSLHFAGQIVELLLDLILNDQRLGRFRAGNALVERTGDLRVLLAHAAVKKDEFFLEIRAREHQHRHNDHHTQRQLPVERKHHHDRQQQIRDVPHALHQTPGQRACNAVGIGHDARVGIADAVLVEVGEGQRLQMVERLAL